LKLPVDTVKHIAGKVKHRHHHHHDVDAAPAGARADSSPAEVSDLAPPMVTVRHPAPAVARGPTARA
jgi:hypothetical protein